MPDQVILPTFHLPVFVRPETMESALPLRRTLVQVQITGPLACVSVTQHYSNPLNEPAELEYLFPLPVEAAITAFEMRIGSRIVLGNLQERDVAQDMYEEARGQGKQAGLFEQRRPNLFAMRLANVQPGAEIHTAVSYQQRVKYTDGKYEFIYPMGLTPKYDRPENPGEGEGVHAPLAQPGEKIGLLDLEIAVDSGIPSGDPTSPSHSLEIMRLDERHFQVRTPGEQIPDHDFVLRYPLNTTKPAVAGWTSGSAGKEFFLVTMLPPKMEAEPQIPPREFIFVLDRSGSMTGEPIAQARNALRACLRTLSPADTFRILLFDHQLEWFSGEPVPVTQAQIDQADAYLGKVQGRGGTEILRALEAVLTLPEYSHGIRYVVFLTDGAVSAEARALEKIRAQIGNSRLFTFGIGPSVNRALLNRMARLGRGRATFMQLDEDIEGAIIEFQDSVSFPALTGLSLQAEGAKLWDVYPARLPDLYYGEPLEISGRLSRAAGQEAHLVLHGNLGSQPVDQRVALALPTGKDQALERVWAWSKVEDLLEQQEMEPDRAERIRADILGLALDAGLVTPYTSFVAVDQDAAQSGGKPRKIKIAQPLPKGLRREGFFPRAQMNMMGMVQSASFMAPSVPPDMARQAGGSSLRTLMSKLPGRVVKDRALDAGDEMAVPDHSRGREAPLRWLARTQKVDGSWEGDIERSAVAVIAFARAGYTTRSGPFRQALRKAVSWLESHPGSGLAAFLRALAFEELSRATGDEKEASLAQEARHELGQPANLLERAACGEPVQPPVSIQTLDDLRLAGILNIHLPVPRKLEKSRDSDLVLTWSAAIAE